MHRAFTTSPHASERAKVHASFAVALLVLALTLCAPAARAQSGGWVLSQLQGYNGAQTGTNTGNGIVDTVTVTPIFKWTGPTGQATTLCVAEFANASLYGASSTDAETATDGLGDQAKLVGPPNGYIKVSQGYHIVSQTPPSGLASGGTITLPSVTITASVPAGYTATEMVNFSAYPVNLYVSGGTAVGSAAEAVTGQTITAKASVDPDTPGQSPPSGYSLSGYQWSTSGGSPFETWNPNTIPQYVALSPGDADSTSANFYYNDAINDDSVAVTCNATITFPPGGGTSTVSLKSQPITFLKPTATWDVDPATITPSGQKQPVSNPVGFVDSSPSNFSVNTTWYPVTISVPSPFSGGQGCFAQVTTPTGSITRTPTGTGVATYTLKMQNAQGQWVVPGTGLDTAFPYPSGLTTDTNGQISGTTTTSLFNAGSTGASGDNPSCPENPPDLDKGGTDWTSVTAWNVNFTTWLMYMPPGGVWIPLKKATWSGNGSASGGPSAWHAMGGYTAPAPVTVTGNASDFPQWNTIISGVVFHP